MIHVIASIRVRHGCLTQYLQCVRDNLPSVRAENGCVLYEPCLDADAGWETQALDPEFVTFVETWETLEALQAHSRTRHMVAFRERTGHLVDTISIRVVRPV